MQSRGQTKAEPVNVTKHSYDNVMEQDLLFPLASKLDFSRELLQPSTQQPPKAPAPRCPSMLPLFHWWGMKQSFLHNWAVQHLLWSHAPSLFQRGFPGREVLQCSKTQTTWALPSRPARTCVSLTRTCLLHLSGVLCLNRTGSNSSNAPNRLPVQTGRQERDGSITARAGWHSSYRESWQKASSFLPAAGIARERRKAEHPHPMHAPHVRHSGALMASVPCCGVAWLPPGRHMMKAESGKKLQPRCQTSTQDLQQAGSSNTAQSWLFGGWWCGFPPLQPSPPCLASIQLLA